MPDHEPAPRKRSTPRWTVSAEKRSQQERQTSADLLSMVSHELRTPLATIREFTSILYDGIPGPVTNEQQEYLGIIKSNVDRLSRLIDDLLDMSKLEAGRAYLNKDFIEVQSLVTQVVEAMRPFASRRGIALKTEMPKDMPSTCADSDKITQVLTNLLNNALQYTQSGGSVTVRVQVQRNALQFTIEDTGVGIAPEELPRLFEKFHRAKRTDDAKGTKGTGLGLAISKNMVELHGGQIWVESLPGAGSQFHFTLPIFQVEEVLHDDLRNKIAGAKNDDAPLSVLVLSVTNYHQLTALYGPENGGQLLRGIEKIIQRSVRRSSMDFVIRWQQGEVVVILSEMEASGMQDVAVRLLQQLKSMPITLGDGLVRPTFAVSTATYPLDGTTAERLLGVLSARAAEATERRKRILVIDDEPKLREFMEQVLTLREFDVTTASNGPEAFTQLKAQSVDLILLDLLMPVMDGYEVYHLLKENEATRDIPVIIVTAKGERKDRLLGMDGGSYNYVMKPFRVEDLLSKIHEVLQQHEADS